MKTGTDVIAQLGELFRDCLSIDVPAADTDLIEAGFLDSLQLIQLLLRIEERFGVRIRLDTVDLDDLRSLERLGRLVASSAAPQPA